MPNDDDLERLPPMPKKIYDWLRDANEQLTLKALQNQERAEESEQRYLDQNEANKLLVRKQQLLRSLVSALTLTEQRERKHLATELHDYLAQMMVLGRLKIGMARSHVVTSDPELVSLIGEIDEIFTKSLAYARTLIAELSPPVLYELGLPSALKWLGEDMLKYGLKVDVHLSHYHVPLLDDQRMLLYQSVRELLLNVVKHAKTSQATLCLTIDGSDQLRIVVQDAGVGFERDLLKAKSSGDHFGLFSISERMEAMGGRIHTDSAPNRGTSITLVLPLNRTVKSESEYSGITTPDRAPVRQTSKASDVCRVLLVDDHAMVRQGLRTILEDYVDVTVIGEAGNGLDAVSMAADKMPDVVLMDINMPKMDGIEATKQIKTAQPAIIVIGLSVNNSAQVMEAMKLAGASALLSKEAAAEELHDIIAAMAPLSPKPANSSPLPL